MSWKGTVAVAAAIGLVGLVSGLLIGHGTRTDETLPLRTVADYLHAVIEADRTFYTQHIVERMEAMLIVTASEEWREKQALPLPAQFLQEASRGLRIRGEPFRYRLVSLWPINPHNAPASDQGRQALNRVVQYGEVVEDYVTVDQRRYFRAIYPDRAVSPACVSCHNTHPKSSKRDFTLNDVMGGLEILVPAS